MRRAATERRGDVVHGLRHRLRARGAHRQGGLRRRHRGAALGTESEEIRELVATSAATSVMPCAAWPTSSSAVTSTRPRSGRRRRRCSVSRWSSGSAGSSASADPVIQRQDRTRRRRAPRSRPWRSRGGRRRSRPSRTSARRGRTAVGRHRRRGGSGTRRRAAGHGRRLRRGRHATRRDRRGGRRRGGRRACRRTDRVDAVDAVHLLAPLDGSTGHVPEPAPGVSEGLRFAQASIHLRQRRLGEALLGQVTGDADEPDHVPARRARPDRDIEIGTGMPPRRSISVSTWSMRSPPSRATRSVSTTGRTWAGNSPISGVRPRRRRGARRSVPR